MSFSPRELKGFSPEVQKEKGQVVAFPPRASEGPSLGPGTDTALGKILGKQTQSGYWAIIHLKSSPDAPFSGIVDTRITATVLNLNLGTDS